MCIPKGTFMPRKLFTSKEIIFTLMSLIIIIFIFENDNHLNDYK